MKTHSDKTIIHKQKRSIDKKKKIMDAGIAVFSKKSFYKTNSKEIAAQAGVSIGTFYSYFPNKKKLFVELFEMFLNDYSRCINDNDIFQNNLSIQSIIRRFIVHFAETYGEGADFHKEAYILRYSEPDVKSMYDRKTKMERNLIFRLLWEFRDYLKVKDIEIAALVIHSATENLINKIKFEGIMKESRLVDDFTEMIYRYVATY